MIGDTTLSEHLHKLVGVKSEQELENLLPLLWQTRKTGLSDPQKSSLQSLLKLNSPGDLEPYASNNIAETSEAVEGEVSQEQPVLGQTRFSHQVNAALSVPSLSFPSSVVSRSLLSLQVYPLPHFNGPNLGGPAPTTAERNVTCFPELTLQNDVVLPETLGVLPRVKSMTWTVENKSATPANRVAIITLKLQDYTKSPTNEMEVKFQLTKDTLEAVLRSMAYINEQLSRFVGSSSGPLQKKQRQ
ncbi:UNVERIFIED_CONTAM: protein FAR1-RELATED SEQUENCE 3 [Sesamum latifolium]|uniref:Protein FAR1-RELATED SEQUENCE 3 n=1 Tax=Sesamum latifolium TaxID=2727402 RepID=A0AAW2XI68_9LAMI